MGILQLVSPVPPHSSVHLPWAGACQRYAGIPTRASLGLQVGPRTTHSQTHCLCNHLTFFGSTFLVMPNAIDVCQTAELFATFEDNPVVVTTVGCLCVAYVLVVIWARRKDAQDQAKVRLHDLRKGRGGRSKVFPSESPGMEPRWGAKGLAANPCCTMQASLPASNVKWRFLSNCLDDSVTDLSLRFYYMPGIIPFNAPPQL